MNYQMDTLDYIFLFMGITGFLLYVTCFIIIKIDDIIIDEKIDHYFDSIGISNMARIWDHPVYKRLRNDHYIFEASIDKSKFFFFLCEVVGFQLGLLKSYVLPIGLNPLAIAVGLCCEFMLILVAVPQFFLTFYYSYEEHLEYHKKLRKRKNKNNLNSDDNLEHNKKKKPKKRPKKKNQNSKKKNKKKKDRKEKKK